MDTPSFVEVLVISLAINQIIEVWRHSTLFQSQRYLFQVWQHEVAMWKPHPANKIASFIPDVVLCNWCFSIWVALAVVGIFIWGNWMGWWAVMTLGVSRIANLINDVLYFYCRTPKYDGGRIMNYPTEAEYKEELAAMQAETERHKRETNDPFPETEDPQPETMTGLFGTPSPVSAKTNDKTPNQQSPPAAGYP
jgi:hypothetical protein